jgi:hypothetical protein
LPYDIVKIISDNVLGRWFDEFDEDDDSRLSKVELLDGLDKFGCTGKEATELFEHIDHDRNGYVEVSPPVFAVPAKGRLVAHNSGACLSHPSFTQLPLPWLVAEL